MSFEQSLKVPMDRIGALIGKNGNVKSMIEDKCGVKLEIDSEYGDVTIINAAPIQDMKPFKAMEIITAIAKGFSPERAMRLLDDNIMLQVIDLRGYIRSKSSLERVKGRIIGSGGKARRLIEELSGASISIHGHYAAAIGKEEEVRLAADAITMLLSGSKHKSVYNMLQEARRRNKRDKLQLWEDLNE